MAKKLTISTSSRPSVIIHRIAINRECLVYVAVTNKALKYAYGRSRIAYIGTTAAGVDRIASSAAGKARELLTLHGVNDLRFYVVSCKGRKRLQSWKKLERALLLAFRGHFGEVPRCNKQGKRIKERDEFEYFSEKRCRGVLNKYS